MIPLTVPRARLVAVLAAATLLTLPLAGCLDLRTATVPSRLLEGPGGNGWELNKTASDSEAKSAAFGLSKQQSIMYTDRADGSRGYAGSLQLLTVRGVFTQSEQTLRDTLDAQVRSLVKDAGVGIEGRGVSGSRTLGNRAESLFFVYNGSVAEADGIFEKNARVKILGEVFQCRTERTNVLVFGLAQVTSTRTVGGVRVSDQPDDTTWREIAADPSGSIDGIRGSRGLVYNVQCR